MASSLIRAHTLGAIHAQGSQSMVNPQSPSTSTLESMNNSRSSSYIPVNLLSSIGKSASSPFT